MLIIPVFGVNRALRFCGNEMGGQFINVSE
jgi:hypothetical protein